MNLIQVLPVNDSFEDLSPYSAKSAFALNPIYIRLSSFKDYAKYRDKALEEKFIAEKRVPYKALYQYKKFVLKKIFLKNIKQIEEDIQFHKWIESNIWVRRYCTYAFLKEQNEGKVWMQWEEYRDPESTLYDQIWDKYWEEVLFFAWVQYTAEKQFIEVSETLDKMGVKLKGDIPILINEDSADVWGWRKYFDLNYRAGAPPDMFCYTGQNWGFPTYKWDILEQDGYSWWKRRLQQCSKFYHALRIDHVLGFFRIWQIDHKESTGILGAFNPYLPIQKEDLLAKGIAEATIDYLADPVYSEGYLNSLFGDLGFHNFKCYFQQVSDNNFKLAESVDNEKKIFSLEEAQNVKDILMKVYWNRVFIKYEEGYSPYWYYYETTVFNDLPEKESVRDLINENYSKQESYWEDNGRQLLTMMCDETEMLICAEDLGVIPNCVPKVLTELDVLSLKIERWTRKYDREGAPFIDPNDYNRLSVCSPSCHDSSTIRGYWQEEWDKDNYYHNYLKLDGDCPEDMNSELAQLFLQRILTTNSIICIVPIQDFLAMNDSLISDENPQDERINVPGTLDSTNWTWKLGFNIEDLLKKKAFNKMLKGMVEQRLEKQF